MLKQFLLSPLCLHCGSLGVQKNLFCTNCYELLMAPKILTNHEFFKNNRHVFLIPWGLSDLECVSQLVYRIKNLQSPEAMSFYMQKLSVMLKNLNLQSPQNVLIPIPSSRSQLSHAHEMANWLSKAGFGTVYDVLIKKNHQQQKHLKLSLRGHSGFSIKTGCEDFTRNLSLQNSSSHQVLFIDDVLTTGQSFKRCSELLAIEKKALCVTLFYREKAE
jgi:predicted amidophosphoribosyltransferase